MKTIVLVALFLIPLIGKAQIESNNKSHNNRYTIVQSPIAVKLTFKLDTYTGAVSQLVVDTDGKVLWQLKNKLPSLGPDTQHNGESNYTMFVSTLGVAYTYLMNTNTGTTWRYVEDSEGKRSFFEPMDDK